MAEEPNITIKNCPKDLLLFRAAVRKIFRDTSECVSEAEFSDNWTILKEKKKTSRQLYTSLVQMLCKNMETELDEFITEEGLVEKFNTLKRLSEESDVPEDHIAWRPPGDVMEHLRPLDAAQIKEHTEKIEEYVHRMEAENKKLMQRIAKGRSLAKHVDQKADILLSQNKRVRLEFEKTAKQIEGDIRKMQT